MPPYFPVATIPTTPATTTHSTRTIKFNLYEEDPLRKKMIDKYVRHEQIGVWGRGVGWENE